MDMDESHRPEAGKATPHDEGGRKKAYKSVVYPAFTLKRCIENAKEIEAKYGTARLERRVAAELLGYTVSKKGLHGTATKALTAMSAFGLMESAGRGSVRITPQAKRVLYPASKVEKASDLRTLAFRPPLFAIIRERFDGADVVPQDGVIAFLMQEDYEPRYVRPAAKSYVDTVRFLQEEAGSVAPSGSHEEAGKRIAEHSGVPVATDADDQVSLVLRDKQARLPAITIQLPNNGNIVGSRELKNLVGLLQAYQPVLEAAESAEDDDRV